VLYNAIVAIVLVIFVLALTKPSNSVIKKSADISGVVRWIPDGDSLYIKGYKPQLR